MAEIKINQLTSTTNYSHLDNLTRSSTSSIEKAVLLDRGELEAFITNQKNVEKPETKATSSNCPGEQLNLLI